MIGRVFKGRAAYGLVKYLYGAGRRNEHTDVHLIASWDGGPDALEPEFLAEPGVHRVAPLVGRLEQPVRACERAPTQYVYHLVLRNDESDRRLSDEQWAEVCRTAMDRTGIAPHGDPAGCRWVAVRHADDHVHLVATLAREDGRAPRVWNDYARLAEVRHEFEDRYGLRSTAGRDDQTAAARPGVKEHVTAERRGRREAPRVTLRQRVKTAAAGSHGFGEFTDRLAADGVTVWPRMSERDPEQITGYSVSLDDWTNAAGEPVRFGGGKLAPDLSWPKLNARWAPVTTDDAPQPAAGAGRRTAAGQPPPAPSAPPRTPLTEDEAQYVWREAERIVREAAERISAAAGADPDAAADAAWAASDTLSAAAAGLEGEAGGPVTDAAAAFDRAGRESYRRVPTRSDTGTALRCAGRMMALLTPGTTPARAQVAALTLALAALTAAVADLRQSQQRLHQAEAAHATAQQLRAAAPAPAPAPTDGPRQAPTAAQTRRAILPPQVRRPTGPTTTRRDHPAPAERPIAAPRPAARRPQPLAGGTGPPGSARGAGTRGADRAGLLRRGRRDGPQRSSELCRPQGHRVGKVGGGINDAPALAAADVDRHPTSPSNRPTSP